MSTNSKVGRRAARGQRPTDTQNTGHKQTATSKPANISIEQYAGVVAAVGVGIPLAAVLSQEQIDQDHWPKAERAWRERIASSEADRLEYTLARRTADDCLARRIDPLDDDPVAWMGLLNALATKAEPQNILTGLGLNSTDFDRLGRLWRDKAANDKTIAEKLAGASNAAVPDKVSLRLVELRPFPWTPVPKKIAPPPAPLSPPRDLAFDHGPVVAQQAKASFQLAPPVEIAVVADETLPILSPGSAQALPFYGALSNDAVRALVAQSSPPIIDSGQDPADETIALRPGTIAQPQAATGTFRDQLTPVVVAAPSPEPEDRTVIGASPQAAQAVLPFATRNLTVEAPPLGLAEYAELRACLAFYGEDHAPTLARFGIASPNAARALQTRFAQFFQQNPAGQRRFLELLAMHTAALRR